MMTAPRPVTLFALANPKTLYPLMLRAGAEAMLKLARKWKGLKAEIAVLALLHTWGQLMNAHLHNHQLVPGGGLSLDGSRWVSMALGEFLPLDRAAASLSRALSPRAPEAVPLWEVDLPGPVARHRGAC